MNPFMTQLAQVARPIDPRVFDLAQQIESHDVLPQPWRPVARLVVTAFYIAPPVFRLLFSPLDRALAKRGISLPSGLQRINNASGYLGATVGTLCDVLAIPLSLYSAHRQGSSSLDWYVPEMFVGAFALYSFYKKRKLWVSLNNPSSQRFEAFSQGLRVFTRSA